MMNPSAHAQSQEKSQSEAGGGLDIETLIGYILLGGVLLSLALLLTGLSWHWVMTGHLRLDFLLAKTNLFQFVRADIGQALSGDWRPGLLIKLGIAALLLTPYTRVLVSMFYFALVERNWKYTVFTGVVFSILTYSLLLQ